MTTDDDRVIARSLEKLAVHAPRYRGFSLGAHDRRPNRYLVPLLASACVVALTVAVSIVVSRNGPGDAPIATSPSSSATSPTDSSSGTPTTEGPVRLEAAASWPHLQLSDCAAWEPAADDSVVQLGRLDDTCITKAPRSSTTVLVAPYTDDAPFGDKWAEVTSPWRQVGGHQLNRLSSGPLIEMSSRVIDAVVCAACDQVIVVLGPDPATVHGLIESVTA